MGPTDQLAATTAGSLALEVLNASKDTHVCGVFSAGLAIEVSGLAIVLSTDPGGWPLGIGLESLPSSLSRKWIGMGVASSPMSLDFRKADCRVDLSQAVVWDGSHALKGLAPSSSAIGQATALARSWLLEHPWASSPRATAQSLLDVHLPPDRQLDGAFERHIASSLEQLIRGLRTQEPTLWSEGVEALLGAGPGLTPAGDDVLAGMVLALQSAGEGPIPALPDLLMLIQRRAASQTTLYGYSSLIAACLGHAPEVVVRALEALFTIPAAVPDRLAALARIGATSGYDMLLGLVAGLDLLAHPARSG